MQFGMLFPWLSVFDYLIGIIQRQVDECVLHRKEEDRTFKSLSLGRIFPDITLGLYVEALGCQFESLGLVVIRKHDVELPEKGCKDIIGEDAIDEVIKMLHDRILVFLDIIDSAVSGFSGIEPEKMLPDIGIFGHVNKFNTCSRKLMRQPIF